MAAGARHCVLEDCAVTHIGGYAVELGPGCKENHFENCEITDMGAGGFKLGEPDIRDDEEAVASNNTIRNCRIAHCKPNNLWS